MIKPVIFYLAGINVVSLCLFGIDKFKARHALWRIPEAALFLSAAAGGTPGALLGMYVFHHKTRKVKFRIGIPALLLLQAVLVSLILSRLQM